ncbi:MAG: electron transfer flavoprotein subunit alpha/FixB family protein [Candidatus Eremiobacteraeota bacterium]|nr:electron transfer flavoprotein subunit alpha/FixB family protein [Candidatus Eremiobacteraeota bacterium]MBV9263179.1 electron transfer flavoprotein subunit alpha/FixB family protein [Candidatus Eremiobacteraeota bacterium]
MKNVLVYAEHRQGATRKVTFELATQARRLADSLGGKAYAVVVGSGARAIAQQLAAYPLDAIYCNEDPQVDTFLLDPVVDNLAAAAALAGPSLILIPNTLSGRDIAGRLMVKLHAGIVADVVDFEIAGESVVCVSPKLGGAITTRCALRPGEFGIATVRPNAFEAAASGDGAKIEELPATAPRAYAAAIENDVEEGSGELALEEAPVVIAGGRGLGGPEPFETLLKPLARALGGAVGASRAAADAGWVPYSLQIGQTGKTVTPNLYIAVGISGAIQHKVGMRSSGAIVAINKDGAAPIGEFSDLLVVGDAFRIVPELTNLIEKAKGNAT